MAGPADDNSGSALSDSEAMLLALVREGRMDAEIAVRLGLSTGEVKDRIERLATKLNVSGRAGLRDLAPAGAAGPTPLPARDREPRAAAVRGFLVLAAILAVAGLAFAAGPGPFTRRRRRMRRPRTPSRLQPSRPPQRRPVPQEPLPRPSRPSSMSAERPSFVSAS